MNSSPERLRAALPVLLARGVVRRCAWCGGKGAFCTSWFGRQERCHTCGLSWERGYEGFELGAATMGVFLTFGSIIAWMIISVVVGVSLVPLLVVAGVIAVAVPILGYPLTYTVWFGVDLFIRQPSAEDLESARAWLASRES
ncbi:MAG: hypothetical protein ACKOCC_07525 [Actinomycetota bacterium]